MSLLAHPKIAHHMLVDIIVPHAAFCRVSNMFDVSEKFPCDIKLTKIQPHTVSYVLS